MSSVIFLFSGQGAQYYQMGAELYANDPVYCSAFDRCSEAVKIFPPDVFCANLA
jgi:acyl transferase domain-containing protein